MYSFEYKPSNKNWKPNKMYEFEVNYLGSTLAWIVYPL